MKCLLHAITLVLAGAAQAEPPAVLPDAGASPPSASNGFSVRVTLAQVDVSENVEDNLAGMRRAFEIAKRDGAEWIIFPEGALSGYTADFDAALVLAAFDRAREMCREAGVYAVIGTSWSENGRKQNQVRIVDPQGKFVGAYSKICLTYDEAKKFVPGESIYVGEAGGIRFGTLICNDLWVTPGFTDGPDPRLSLKLSRAGAKIIFHSVNSGDLPQYRSYHEANLQLRAAEAHCPIVVVNAARDTEINCTSGVVIGTKYVAELPRVGEQIKTFNVELSSRAEN